MLNEASLSALIVAAGQARCTAYAPYSGFQVGAAVVTEDDRVFLGCNVENSSYGLSLCAERSAISTAISSGARSIRALVIVSESDPPASPCGACRQWLAEFGAPDMEIVAANRLGLIRRFRLSDLLPEPFGLSHK